jgi:hypothetical protein
LGTQLPLVVVVALLLTVTLVEAEGLEVVAVALTVELQQDQAVLQHKHQTTVELGTVIMVEQVVAQLENLAVVAVALVKLDSLQRQILQVLEEMV